MRWLALLVAGLALPTGVAAAGSRATGTSEGSVPPWRIVYTLDDEKAGVGGGKGLNVLSSEASRAQRLVRSSVADIWSLAWSPDGRRVAYTIMIPTWVKSRSEQRRRGLYSVLLGGSARHLTTAFDEGEAWSPDSESIAVTRITVTQHGAAELPTVRGGLYIVPSAGGKPRLVARECAAPASSVGTWSPDGKQLVVLCGDAIWVVNADGSGKRRLSGRDDGKVGVPSWSPDGSLIAYGRHCYDVRGGDVFCDLTVICPDATGKRQLERDKSIDSASDAPPVWSSENVLLADTWRVNLTPVGVMSVDPRTGARRRIYPALVSNVTAGSNGTIGFLDQDSLVILDSNGKQLLRRDLPLPSDPWLEDLWLG